MSLEVLQTSLCDLIKDRTTTPLQDKSSYLDEVASSKHLLLVKKVSLWWRKMQIENYCLLTTRLLQSYNSFDKEVQLFLKEKNYSPFREEVGIQFLDFLIGKYKSNLIHSVALFELSLIKLKLGNPVESSSIWKYEPYAIIRSLLDNKFSKQTLSKGKYRVTVSDRLGMEYFHVEPG